MKDFITTIGLLIVGIGIFAAAPAFGIVVGAGLGIWFLTSHNQGIQSGAEQCQQKLNYRVNWISAF